MKISPRRQVKSRRKANAENGAKASSGAFPIVGIGASAGGLEAFSELLRYLPEKTGMAFVLVQHLDPDHESQLAQILARATAIPVDISTSVSRTTMGMKSIRASFGYPASSSCQTTEIPSCFAAMPG